MAIPELLRLLALPGCIVTIEAMGCQTEIATQIVAQGADYVLALKANQGHLYQEVVRLFNDALTDPGLFLLRQPKQSKRATDELKNDRLGPLTSPITSTILSWPGLASVVRIDSHRRLNNQHSHETRYYIASLVAEPNRFNTVVRTHWTIENQLHWVLDVAFREDDSRVRRGYAPENLALLRHMALNLLKQERTTKLSIQNKRLRAAWDNDYLLLLLSFLT